MIKRADIIGSKSNVAKKARLPQATRGNYSDTFNLNQFNIKGSLLSLKHHFLAVPL